MTDDFDAALDALSNYETAVAYLQAVCVARQRGEEAPRPEEWAGDAGRRNRAMPEPAA